MYESRWLVYRQLRHMEPGESQLWSAGELEPSFLQWKRRVGMQPWVVEGVPES